MRRNSKCTSERNRHKYNLYDQNEEKNVDLVSTQSLKIAERPRKSH